MRYESKSSDNFGNIVGLDKFEGKRRDNILVMNYNGWIFSLLTDRTKIEKPDSDASTRHGF